MPLRLQVKAFVSVLAVIAAACFIAGATQWHPRDLLHLLCYLALAMMASTLKITLPGIDGTMSVNFLFILLGVMEMSFAETLAIGAAAVVMQSVWKRSKRIQPIQFIFNLSQLTVTATAAFAVYHASVTSVFRATQSLALMGATITYFLFNTLAMSVVVSLTEQKPTLRVWRDCYFWSFPYYLVGAAIGAMVGQLNRNFGWQTSIVAMPAVYAIYRSYRLYLGKLETEKKHVEDMAGLHLRTIEALALAIEAKDQNTHEHLQRVRVYAMELANDLGLSDDEKEALRAAALLHDIGKLAVPEHIIAKPGKLTPEEFDKMKIHPIVGAEILKEVKFPYPVVPIVRSHHEKWDGTGYPDGLKGEQIPIGARILSAVDCLDALASDRQYRRALPLNQAMAQVVSEAGKAFDPRVVSVLQRRYMDLERMANEQRAQPRTRLSTGIKVERGTAPAAGFVSSGQVPKASSGERGFLSSIVAARREGQMLFELTHELGNSLSLDNTLSILSARLKQLVPYDSIATYIVRDEVLHCEFATGSNSSLFSSLDIPLGQGLSGWVAQNNKPILNGNPSVEPGYLNDPTKFSTLRSAVAVPLECASGVLGVLSLYHAEADAFTSDHVRILLAISSKLGLVIENTIRYRAAEASAGTDSLTGLMNSRSLFQQLEQELGRCRRGGSTLAVFLCDLDQFKSINGQFGHMEGNKLLQALASNLKQACRSYDCVARMGGDEFVVVVPGASKENGREVTQRIVAAATGAGRQMRHPVELSISIGTAVYPNDGNTAEELLTEADHRMYRSKRQKHESSEKTAAVLLIEAAHE
jgi:diguanylate cyclase (GGDEF)-like protein/putative nucleotidyltransferase with HDIG domain